MDDDRLKRHDLSDAEWVQLEPFAAGSSAAGAPVEMITSW
jgi:hypothetical protein